jgi:hypothetical protein
MFILTEHLVEILAANPWIVPSRSHRLEKIPKIMLQLSSWFSIDKG